MCNPQSVGLSDRVPLFELLHSLTVGYLTRHCETVIDLQHIPRSRGISYELADFQRFANAITDGSLFNLSIYIDWITGELTYVERSIGKSHDDDGSGPPTSGTGRPKSSRDTRNKSGGSESRSSSFLNIVPEEYFSMKAVARVVLGGLQRSEIANILRGDTRRVTDLPP
jgi:hypothetical protein